MVDSATYDQYYAGTATGSPFNFFLAGTKQIPVHLIAQQSDNIDADWLEALRTRVLADPKTRAIISVEEGEVVKTSRKKSNTGQRLPEQEATSTTREIMHKKPWLQNHRFLGPENIDLFR